jgi:hypothetical protein
LVGQTEQIDGTLSSDSNVTVDLYIVGCSGGGGTFAFDDVTSVNLNSPNTMTLSYTPSQRGTRSCRVDVYRENSSTFLGSFNISGTGQTPQTMVTSGTPDFGSIRFNDAVTTHTVQRTFTVSNTGDRALNINNPTITGTNAGDFTLSGGNTMPIPGGGARTWTVTFDPSVAGTRTATLTFSGDDTSNMADTFALTGVGTTGVINVTTPIDFNIVNTGSSASADVPVANSGASPRGNLNVPSAAISGGNGWFTFSGCGGGASCTFSPTLAIPTSTNVGVRCSPPAAAAAGAMQTATVTFTSDSDSGTANVATLRCTAGKSDLATNANTVMFAPQLVSTSTMANMVTITNNGNVPATYYLQPTGANQGQFALQTGAGCGLSGTMNQCPIAAMGTSTFTVAFTPGGEGDISAGVNIVPTPGSPVQLTLVGRGIDRHIEMVDTVQFPDTYSNPGTRVSKEVIKVHNSGEYPLHVSQIVIDGAPNWALDTEFTPFDVPGLGDVDVVVQFTPVSAGKAPDGMLRVTSDDQKVMQRNVVLAGNGKDRNVSFAPKVDFGNTGAGIPVSLVTLDRLNDLLTVENKDAEPFMITDITTDMPDVFRVQTVAGDSVKDVPDNEKELLPAAKKQFDVVFLPPDVGEYKGNITLHLDGARQQTVEAYGNALFVDAHGGGGFGCSAGHGAGTGLLFALVFLRRKRRRG